MVVTEVVTDGARLTVAATVAITMAMLGGGFKWKILARVSCLGGRPYQRKLASARKWPKRRWWQWKLMVKMLSPAVVTGMRR